MGEHSGREGILQHFLPSDCDHNGPNLMRYRVRVGASSLQVAAHASAPVRRSLGWQICRFGRAGVLLQPGPRGSQIELFDTRSR